ncbi:MAG: type II secretion system protein [bacterium]
MVKTDFKKNKGFTLVELMVSISLFSIVMLISMGSIMTVLDSNRKSQSLRAVMDNLNFTLESMTRSIRFGEKYHCGTSGTLTNPSDCPSGDTSLTLLAPLPSGTTGLVTYRLSAGKIVKTVGGVDMDLTSLDVTIDRLTFYVLGSASSDTYQPRVLIVVKGHSGTKTSTQTSFTLETTISQRKFDY